MKTVVEAPHGCKGVWVYPLYYFFVYFFCLFSYAVSTYSQKKKHRSARIANRERLRRRHQAKMVPDIHPSSFCFLVFSVPPPPFFHPTFLKLSLSLFLSSSVKIYFFVFLAAAFLPAAPAAGAVAAFTAFLLVPFGLRCVVQRCVATGLVG